MLGLLLYSTCTKKTISVSLIISTSYYRQVTLNGKLLELVDNFTIPDLVPVEQEASKEIKLPTLSFGFCVFKDTKAKACMSI